MMNRMMTSTPPSLLLLCSLLLLVLIQGCYSSTISSNTGNNQNTRLNNFYAYGRATGPYPTWEERSVIVLTNAVRMSPQGYLNYYSSLFPTKPEMSKAQPPLYEHYALDSSARYHARDMAGKLDVKDGCFSHDSCNGKQNFATRIIQFYLEGKVNYLAENIAAGSQTPEQVMALWINSDGHRANIQKEGLRVIGVSHDKDKGQAMNAMDNQWVQNFSSGENGVENPIVAASHLFNSAPTAANMTFMANYYHSKEIQHYVGAQQAQLFLDGKAYEMELHPSLKLGDDPSAEHGTYVIHLERNVQGTGCRSYYFLFTDAARNKWRYPEDNTVLKTVGENEMCTQASVSSASSLASNMFTFAVMILSIIATCTLI